MTIDLAVAEHLRHAGTRVRKQQSAAGASLEHASAAVDRLVSSMDDFEEEAGDSSDEEETDLLSVAAEGLHRGQHRLSE